MSSPKNVVDHVPKITDSAILIEFELVKTPAVQNHDQMLTINSVLELSRLIRVSSCRSNAVSHSVLLVINFGLLRGEKEKEKQKKEIKSSKG